ncbi:hypothetical protein GAMM_60124 [Gammaproteobacteria bacterium]
MVPNKKEYEEKMKKFVSAIKHNVEGIKSYMLMLKKSKEAINDLTNYAMNDDALTRKIFEKDKEAANVDIISKNVYMLCEAVRELKKDIAQTAEEYGNAEFKSSDSSIILDMIAVQQQRDVDNDFKSLYDYAQRKREEKSNSIKNQVEEEVQSTLGKGGATDTLAADTESALTDLETKLDKLKTCTTADKKVLCANLKATQESLGKLEQKVNENLNSYMYKIFSWIGYGSSYEKDKGNIAKLTDNLGKVMESLEGGKLFTAREKGYADEAEAYVKKHN